MNYNNKAAKIHRKTPRNNVRDHPNQIRLALNTLLTTKKQEAKQTRATKPTRQLNQLCKMNALQPKLPTIR
jgi:hypothetical protein